MRLPSRRLVTGWLLVTVVVLWSFVLGMSVEIREQIAIYQVLQNVSGIMFAVFGLWIGLLYPELRKRVFERSHAAPEIEEGRSNDDHVADSLLFPFFLSLVVVLVTLVVVVANPILRQVTALMDYKEFLRGFSFALLSGLALAQLWAICLAMNMTEALKTFIGRQSTRNNVTDRVRQNATKR